MLKLLLIVEFVDVGGVNEEYIFFSDPEVLEVEVILLHFLILNFFEDIDFSGAKLIIIQQYISDLANPLGFRLGKMHIELF